MIYRDDICVGATIKELKHKILEKLNEADMTKNKDKCVVNFNKLSILGNQI